MQRLLMLSLLLCLSCVGYAQNVEGPKIAPPPKLIFRLPEEDTKTPRNYDMLTAAVEKPVVDGFEAVTLKFAVKNTTDKILTWWPNSRSVFKDYQIRVKRVSKDKDGKETLTLMPLTEFGKAALGSFGISRGWFTNLKPGESTREISIAINRYFDMTLPGTYSITVHQHAVLGGEVKGITDFEKNEQILMASRAIQVEVQ